MLGFVPGFTYMGPVDESIAAPRHATPRATVRAGSVGIAGRQTAIYPQDIPGGWQIIGRTRVRLFDDARTPPSLFTAGDEVRFVPVPTLSDTGPDVPPPIPTHEVRPGEAAITVLRPGLLTTIQDLGRWGHQDRGVPVAGPMDPTSHRLANIVVGNRPEAATIEVTLLGPELRIERDLLLAVAGADLSPTLDRQMLKLNAPVRARSGSVLRFGERRHGARAYVSVAGGIDVRPVLGSRATHVPSRMGGLDGRPLAAGDRLGLTAMTHAAPVEADAAAQPAGGARLRVLAGPQDDFFEAPAWTALERRRFTVTPRSNRMAYRLSGATIERASDREMISDATFMGGIQVPPGGDPILLMADRQTTGGYPQIATVITADLPLAAQVAPGDWVEFSLCTRREALAALIAQEGKLLAVR
jgi:biotin-dependent carboxylase-like uncharacterized protein